MILFDYHCCDVVREQLVQSINTKDSEAPSCVLCGKQMQPCPGGKALLYFEEGRARRIEALSDKPITSHAEHKRLMKLNGVSEMGSTVPKSIKNPKNPKMKEVVAKGTLKGRWE